MEGLEKSELLISARYVKENSVIYDNVSDEDINPIISLAQNKHILPIVGESLGKDLLNQIRSGSISPDYQNLLENYLQKATLWWTLSESVLPLSYKSPNKSVWLKFGDNSQPPAMADLLKLKDQFMQNAEYYSERAKRHLRANLNTYPQYQEQ